MGKCSARMADLGRARLAQLGLDGVKAPMLRDQMCKSCACQRGSVPNGCLGVDLRRAIFAEREACETACRAVVHRPIEGASDDYMDGKEMALVQCQRAILARNKTEETK